MLQRNLDEQIRSNKESQEKVMREANSLIENERARMRQIHEEEIRRVKEMGEW
jgi:hypothetical protein